MNRAAIGDRRRRHGSPPIYYEYAVQPGDGSLASIIRKLYGCSPPTLRYAEVRQFVLAMNPQLKDRERPWPGETLLLPGAVSSVRSSAAPRVVSALPDASARQQLWAMAWAQHSGLLTIPGGIALGAASNLLSGGNVDLLRQVGDEYAAYRRSGGRITRGQYDHRRRQLVGRFRQSVGPVERWLFRGLTTPEAIRIARHGGIPRDHHIQHLVGRLRQLASLASKGGIVLTAVGVGAACAQIAHTADRKEKNEIFVDTVASMAFGSFAGYAVALFLASNPIGWGTALVIAVGSAVASRGGGQGVTKLYDVFGNEIDLVGGLGVDRVCRT